MAIDKRRERIFLLRAVRTEESFDKLGVGQSPGRAERVDARIWRRAWLSDLRVIGGSSRTDRPASPQDTGPKRPRASRNQKNGDDLPIPGGGREAGRGRMRHPAAGRSVGRNPTRSRRP